MTSYSTSMLQWVILRSRQNGCKFPDDIFKCIFLDENVWILLNISLKFVTKVQIKNILALVQITAWHQSGDKPLSQPMVVYFGDVYILCHSASVGLTWPAQTLERDLWCIPPLEKLLCKFINESYLKNYPGALIPADCPLHYSYVKWVSRFTGHSTLCSKAIQVNKKEAIKALHY